MSLTSYRAAPSRVRLDPSNDICPEMNYPAQRPVRFERVKQLVNAYRTSGADIGVKEDSLQYVASLASSGPGSDLLSRALRRSTIGARGA